MNRSFPVPAREARVAFAREALVVLAGAVMFATACEPNQDVKPGAPELTEFTIVTAGPAATTVKTDTPDCASTADSGTACDPASDTLCRHTSDMNWCTCVVPDMMTPDVGVWNCDPFADVVAVIAVFDRLLDTAPLDPGTDPGRSDLLTASTTPPFDLSTDYSSTGDANGLIFNLFGPAFFGNFRGDGPSLFATPLPEFPSGTTVMVTIDGTKVRSKDGTHPFIGKGALMSGTLTFTTAPFMMNVAAPDAMAMDPTAATVMFTNFVKPEDVTPLITAATSGGTAIPVAVAATDATPDGAMATTFAVTPAGGAWPAGAMVVISVDAAAKNLLAQSITPPLSGMPFAVP
jgi:hypothetical protein